MTLQQLKYIITVAETGNITEAAEKLFIAQPSLTAAIHAIETEMNVTIFSRTNKGVAVTREGEELLSYCYYEQTLNLRDYLLGDNKNLTINNYHYNMIRTLKCPFLISVFLRNCEINCARIFL